MVFLPPDMLVTLDSVELERRCRAEPRDLHIMQASGFWFSKIKSTIHNNNIDIPIASAAIAAIVVIIVNMFTLIVRLFILTVDGNTVDGQNPAWP